GEFVQAIRGAAAKRQLTMENGEIFQGDRFNKKPFTGESEPVDALRKAYNEIKEGQGGIGTVYIGDLIEKSGLSSEQVHDFLRKAAREGDASVNKTSVIESSLSASRRENALKINGEKFHTVTFKRPVPQFVQAIRGAAAKRQLTMENGELLQGDRF